MSWRPAEALPSECGGAVVAAAMVQERCRPPGERMHAPQDTRPSLHDEQLGQDWEGTLRCYRGDSDSCGLAREKLNRSPRREAGNQNALWQKTLSRLEWEL